MAGDDDDKVIVPDERELENDPDPLLLVSRKKLNIVRKAIAQDGCYRHKEYSIKNDVTLKRYEVYVVEEDGSSFLSGIFQYDFSDESLALERAITCAR